MKNVEINNNTYCLEENYKDSFDLEEITSLCTDYFNDFDYIFGDCSYSKWRLKGFYESTNKKVKAINDIKNLSSYIEKYCAYDCKYFLLHKEKVKE